MAGAVVCGCAPATLANAFVRIARHPQGRKSDHQLYGFVTARPLARAVACAFRRTASACCERIAAVRSSRPFLDNTSLAADAQIGVSHGAQAISAGAIRSAISSGEGAGSPLSTTGISKILVPRGARLTMWAMASSLVAKDTASPSQSPVESAWTPRA